MFFSRVVRTRGQNLNPWEEWTKAAELLVFKQSELLGDGSSNGGQTDDGENCDDGALVHKGLFSVEV